MLLCGRLESKRFDGRGAFFGNFFRNETNEIRSKIALFASERNYENLKEKTAEEAIDQIAHRIDNGVAVAFGRAEETGDFRIAAQKIGKTVAAVEEDAFGDRLLHVGAEERIKTELIDLPEKAHR
jgi:hypothetical protein